MAFPSVSLSTWHIWKHAVFTHMYTHKRDTWFWYVVISALWEDITVRKLSLHLSPQAGSYYGLHRVYERDGKNNSLIGWMWPNTIVNLHTHTHTHLSNVLFRYETFWYKSGCKRFVVCSIAEGKKRKAVSLDSRRIQFIFTPPLSFYLYITALSPLYITGLFAQFIVSHKHAWCPENW